MKILYTLNSGNPGGMEQHVLDLVKGMVKNGQEVHVWCKEGEISKWFASAGAHVTIPQRSQKRSILSTFLNSQNI
jgi:hypothetical protein